MPPINYGLLGFALIPALAVCAFTPVPTILTNLLVGMGFPFAQPTAYVLSLSLILGVVQFAWDMSRFHK